MTGATTKDFVLDGTRIISETSSRYTMIYLYDETGSPIGIKYRSALDVADEYELFFFEKNLQGDVVAIYNEAGTKIASYTYDAWGNTTKTRPTGVTYSTADTYIYNNNPFTYRGYYYDSQTGLYYLQTRYYDPSIGRFINADGYVNANGDIIGFNMYAYCSNNPIMYVDHAGTFAILTAVICGVVSVGCVLLSGCGGQQNEPPQKRKRVSFGTFDELHVCSDGAKEGYADYKDHQDKTAYMSEELDAGIHSYIVFPVNDPRYLDALGCIALVQDLDTGKSVFAIVGDGGNTGVYNEVSMNVVKRLGYPTDATESEEGNFRITIFWDTERDWDPKKLNEEAKIYGLKHIFGGGLK